MVPGIAGLGLNLVQGTTGLLSLGHAAYFGLGACAGAFLFSVADVQSLEVYLLAGVATAALAGAWCVRGTRIHFTIMTLAFGQLVHAVFIVGVPFRLMGDFGKGLFYVGDGGSTSPASPSSGPSPRSRPSSCRSACCGASAARRSGWRSARSATPTSAPRSSGSPCGPIGGGRSSFPARSWGWPGGLYGQLDRQVTPEQLHGIFSAKLVVATIIGGTRWFLGPVVGAAVFVLLQHLANRFVLSHGLVLGGLLLAVTFACPGGILGAAATALRKVSRPRLPSADPVAP